MTRYTIQTIRTGAKHTTGDWWMAKVHLAGYQAPSCETGYYRSEGEARADAQQWIDDTAGRAIAPPDWLERICSE